MSYGTSTHAQRLQWQYEEGRHGYDADPSLEEVFDEQDAKFRHWETFIFAPGPLVRLGGTPGRDGVAVTPPDHGRSDPANSSRPAAMEASTLPLASSRSDGEVTGQPPPSEPVTSPNPSIQRWMWTP